MRKRYIVTYDVREPSRLRKVFQVMRGFGDHLQYSVFRCDLTETELVLLKRDLLEVINSREDQALFVNLGPTEGRGDEVIESVGVAYVPPPGGPVIV
jgi:CRISPR-associated protein Cas2